VQTICYRIVDTDFGPHTSFYDLATDLDPDDELDQELLASDCAEDYHDFHDGRESTWPLVLAIHKAPDEPEVFVASVDRETVPHFPAQIED